MQFRKYLSFPAVFVHHNIVEEETYIGFGFWEISDCLPADMRISSVSCSGWRLPPLECVIYLIFLIK